MHKLIYICSLSHSGSTLLGLLLGKHPEVVCLGEITKSLKSYYNQQNICTCGDHALDCKIWGPVIQNLKNNEKEDFPAAYDMVIEKTVETYGSDIRIVDSNKDLNDLLSLISLKKYDIRVIFLAKDIRSYIASMNKRYKKLREKDKRKDSLNKLNAYNAYDWYRSNKKIKKALSQIDIGYFQLGYEELCLKPQNILQKLCNWLGIEFYDDMLTPMGAESHIIRGNLMRYDEKKLQGIIYDYGWLTHRNLYLYHLIFSGVNKKLVYSNTKKT
ncbi:MAG: sulfotransferase [Bacteroidales bacterium]